MKKTILLVLLVLFLVGGATLSFGQVKGAFALVCNVTGARVYLNGELAGYTKPTFSVLLLPRQYTLKVTSAGYKDFTTTFTMTTHPYNINVNLERVGSVSRYNLSVNSNVAGAQVFVDNVLVGNAPVNVPVDAGSRSLKVAAPGYQDYVTTLSVNGNTSHNAVLQAQQVRLSVAANVNGAQVYLNNIPMGTIPFRGQLAPGSYTLRVSAPGFQDASLVVNLIRDESLTVSLAPGQASVNVTINPAYLDPQNRNALAQVKVFINGKFENGFSFELPPGRHNIRISSGGLSMAGDYDLEAGRSYTIEPVFGLTVR